MSRSRLSGTAAHARNLPAHLGVRGFQPETATLSAASSGTKRRLHSGSAAPRGGNVLPNRMVHASNRSYEHVPKNKEASSGEDVDNVAFAKVSVTSKRLGGSRGAGPAGDEGERRSPRDGMCGSRATDRSVAADAALESVGSSASLCFRIERLDAISSSAFWEFRIPEADREDLRQDVLISLVTARREVLDPEAWFLASLRNRCRRYWREEDRRIQAQADAARPLAKRSRPRSISGAVDIKALLSKLKPMQARLLIGRVFEGKSYAELSALLGPTAASLRRILVRILKRLRALAGAKPDRHVSDERKAPGDPPPSSAYLDPKV